MTPSTEAVVKIAEVLDVTTDYLLVETSPRRPHSPKNILGDRLAVVAELADNDLGVLRSVIDVLVAKTRLKALADGVS